MSYRKIAESERVRRLSVVRSAAGALGLDAVIVLGVAQISENRGNGWLSWLFGYTLEHRYGYGLVHVPGNEDILVFPEGMTWALREMPEDSYRCAPYHAQAPLAAEVVDVLRGWNVPAGARIGVIGLDEMLPVTDYRYLTENLPGADFTDVSAELAPARQRKEPGELMAFRESNAVAEAGWAAARDSVGAGVSIRELGAEVYRAIYAAGAVDTLLLSLSGTGGRCGSTLVVPAATDQVLADGDVLTVSMELTGQGGYWVEHARQFVIGSLADDYRRLMDTAVAAIELFESVAVPGATGGEVFRICDELIRAAGFHQGHTPGHGLGMDVLEHPRIAPYDTTELTDKTVLAFHPHVLSADEKTSAYLADSYVVQATGAVPLSVVERRPLELARSAR